MLKEVKMLNIIGLILVCIAWIIQLYFVSKGDKEIKTSFLLIYIIGVAFLLVNEFKVSFWLDLLSIILALVILIKVSMKPKHKKKK